MFTFTTQFRAGEKSTGAGDKITALNPATNFHGTRNVREYK